MNASDFNVTFENTVFDLSKDSNKAIFSFFCPEGIPIGMIVVAWGDSDDESDSIDISKWDVNTYMKFYVYDLYYLRNVGIYNVTIYFEDNDGHRLELAKGLLNATKRIDPEEFIELEKENIYSAEDYIIYVHEIDSAKLKGALTIYYNGSTAFTQLFDGERAGMLIYGKDLVGVFNGTCVLNVVYERNADGKKYSRNLTVNFINPIINKPLTPEDFNLTLVNEVNIKDEDSTVISFDWPEKTTVNDCVRIDGQGISGDPFYKQYGETNKIIKFGDLYIFELGNYNLTISYYKDGNTKLLEIANGILKVTKTYTPDDFIEVYSKDISGPTDYVCNVYDSTGSGLKGKVTVLANGTQVYNYTGSGEISAIRINANNLTGNLEGEYAIKIIYNRATDGKEYSKQAFINFPGSGPTPSKTNSTVNVSDVILDYGSSKDVAVTTAGATGFTAMIDDVTAIVRDGAVVVSGLSAGNHTLSVTTIPDENHTSVTETATISVNKVNSTVSVSDVVLDYGSSKDVAVTTAGATGFIAMIDDVSATVNDGFVVVSDLSIGNHTLSVTTIPDENHTSVTKTAKITVKNGESGVVVPDITFDYGTSGNSTIIGLTDIHAIVSDDKAIVKVENNVVTVSGLDAGNYTLTVTGTDANNKNVTKEATVTVNKVDSSVSVSAITFNYGSSGSATVTLSGADAFTANIAGHADAVSISGNKITVSGLDADKYTLSVVTVLDANHNSVTKDVAVTVNKLKTAVSASKVTAVYGTSKNIVVTLKDANGKPLSNKMVSVKLNGVTYNNRATNSKGQISIAVPKNLVPKTYTASITFAGDTNYVKSTGSVKVVVKKATPKLTAKAKTFKKAVKTKKYSITLKTNLNKVMKNIKLTLKVNKKTYSAKTNAKGQATFKITKLTKKGKYTAAIAYKGNKYYNKLTKNVKIIVK